MPNPCLHCEQAPQENYLRLCDHCARQRGWRRIYKKTASWTPQRDARIQAMVEKAKQQKPLFEDDQGCVLLPHEIDQGPRP